MPINLPLPAVRRPLTLALQQPTTPHTLSLENGHENHILSRVGNPRESSPADLALGCEEISYTRRCSGWYRASRGDATSALPMRKDFDLRYDAATVVIVLGPPACWPSSSAAVFARSIRVRSSGHSHRQWDRKSNVRRLVRAPVLLLLSMA